MQKYWIWIGLLLMNIFIGCDAVESRQTTFDIQIGEKTYNAILYDNPSAKAFLNQMPLTLNMQDLHNNEKYAQLPSPLPVDSNPIRMIKTGELLLFSSNYLVLFYKDFASSYSYTRLGRIKNLDNLPNTLGDKNTKITFKKTPANQQPKEKKL